MIDIELPIYWTQEFKTKNNKTVLVGMNWYRNAFYHAQNSMKKEFSALVADQLESDVVPNQFRLNISLYYKNASCDGANIVALVEKFVLDALQENNVITNDNVKYHMGTTWSVIEQDKENPRCLINVSEVK